MRGYIRSAQNKDTGAVCIDHLAMFRLGAWRLHAGGRAVTAVLIPIRGVRDRSRHFDSAGLMVSISASSQKSESDVRPVSSKDISKSLMETKASDHQVKSRREVNTAGQVNLQRAVFS